jgi:N-acetylneuraminic acid mutarotase
LKRLLIVPLIFFLAACQGTPAPGNLQGDTSRPSATSVPVTSLRLDWSPKAPILTPRSEITSSLVNGVIYVIGGFTGDGTTSGIVEAYDIAANRWSRKADMPAPRDHPAAAAINGRVYVPGGYNGDAQRTLFIYDAATDRWTRGADMPLTRAAHAAVAVGTKLYVFGGVGERPTAAMEYDTTTERWSIRADMSAPREHLAGAGASGKVYAIGGRWQEQRGLQNKPVIEEFDPAANTWRRRSDMPTSRGGLSAATLNSRIYVFGGEAFDPERTFSENEIYDPATDHWTQGPPMPTSRHGLTSQGAGDTVFVIAGGETAGLSVTGQTEALTVK